MRHTSACDAVLLGLLLLGGAGCLGERTELVIGMATDLVAPDEIDAIHLEVARTGAPTLIRDWAISGFADEPFNLPASFAIYPRDDDDEPTVHITLSGRLAGKEIVQRRATLKLIAHRALFLRMALVSRCRRKPDPADPVCPQEETCIEGVCTPERIDADLLPRYRDSPFPRERAAECRGRAELIDTATRQPLFEINPEDCSDGERCIESICYPTAPHCNDDEFNGDETALDCGGPSCRGCLGKQLCRRDSDCISGSCNDKDEDPPEACAATVSFQRFPFIAPDFGRVSLAAGDFDGDDDADVFVAHEGSSTVDVYPSAPDIILGAPRTLSTEDGPIAITVRDFNRDNILDFAVVYRGLVGGDNGVQVFRSRGGQPFDRHDSYPLSPSRPAAIASGDLNEDGLPDLVTANSEDGTISVLLNDGDGGFLPAANYLAGPVPRAVVIAKLDGHQADIVVASTDNLDFDGNVSVLHNRGDGTFGEADPYRAGMTPRALVAGDFDGDDKDDLAIIDDTGGVVYILFNEGTPGTGPQDPIQFRREESRAIGAEPTAIAVGDFEADVTEDLVVANRGDGTISVLADYDDGVFAQTGTYGAGAHARAIAIADFDGDGLGDMVVATDSGLVVLHNTAE